MFDDGADGDGEIPVNEVALGEIGEAGELVVRMVIADTDFAGVERVPAEDAAEEGGFACAVGTEDGRETAAEDVNAEAIECGDGAVADGDVGEAQDVVGGVGQGKVKAER